MKKQEALDVLKRMQGEYERESNSYRALFGMIPQDSDMHDLPYFDNWSAELYGATLRYETLSFVIDNVTENDWEA
jgi:hypothetical protein